VKRRNLRVHEPERRRAKEREGLDRWEGDTFLCNQLNFGEGFRFQELREWLFDSDTP